MGQIGEFELLEGAIQENKRAIRVYFTFSLIVILLGVAIIVFGVLFAKQLLPEVGKTLFGLGGGFVTSLSFRQLKDILAREDRIRHLESLKKQLIILEKNVQENFNQIKELKTRIWNYCEKISS